MNKERDNNLIHAFKYQTLPRVTMSIKSEPNYSIVVKDSRPIIAYYVAEGCEICKEIDVFLKQFICARHFQELQEGKTFTPCPSDVLFPLEFRVHNTPQQPAEGAAESPSSSSSTESDEDEEKTASLPPSKKKRKKENCESKENIYHHHSVLYRLPTQPSSSAEKEQKQKSILYNELSLLKGVEVSTVKQAIRLLKTSLHLMPSENKWRPQLHQEHAKEHYRKRAYLEEATLLAMKLGAGKTSGALYIIEQLKNTWKLAHNNIFITCPNTIIEYWNENINTFPTFVPSDEPGKPYYYHIMGETRFGEFVKTSSGLNQLRGNVAIVDECQRFRNLTSKMKLQLWALQVTRHTFGLSGGLLVNDPRDILGAAALMKGSKQSSKKLKWATVDEMEQELQRYEELIEQKDPSFVKDLFAGRAYYFDPQKHSLSSLQNYPLLVYSTHFVNMSLSQMLEYLRNQKKSIQIGNIEVVTAVRNSYGMKSKTLANSCESDGAEAPKFLAVQENIAKEPRFPQVIFSRFLIKGIETLYASLSAKFPTLRIQKVTGVTPTDKRNSIFNKYNQGSLDILLISNVGGVGLDLHNSAAMHLFECAENQQTESQAAHRVSRFNSHKSLQLTTRAEVKIHRYISKFPDLNDSFLVTEVKDAEQLFSKYYGDLLTLCPTTTGSGRKTKLLESQDENTFTLKGILQQMKDQLTEPYSVEETMLRKNLQKEAEIAPFFQAFEKVAEQLVPF